MPVSTPVKSGNLLLVSLPHKERNQIQELSESVDLASGDILCRPGLPFTHVYFPVTAFVSLVKTVRDEKSLEIGLIGSEGMLGVTLVLGITAAPLRGVVLGAGTALRMRADQFTRMLRETPALCRILNHYLYLFLSQLSQTAACARFHDIDSRLAFWLLMTRDRAHADHFHLTHEDLADMLGVRRSSITIAAVALQQGGIISYIRGDIRILDLRRLEAVCCECYAVLDGQARLLH